jgi:hypothetical protein
LETNVFYFSVEAMLSQPGDDDLLHLVSFRSHKFSLVDINYEIDDKEFLAIVDAFEEWHHLFKGVQLEILVYFYHKNL